MNRIEHPADRFWRKVHKGDGCWLWLGGLFDRGYGRFALDPKVTVRAHRYAWELANGQIPDGLIVCHRCDNPKCVNPEHLFLGTHKDNAEDRERKGRGAGRKRRGAAHPLAKLKAEEVRAIRSTEGISDTAWAEFYGVSESQIGRIRRGESWVSG